MLVDALRQHEVEGKLNRMVEKVKGLEIKQEVAEIAKEVVEVAKKVIRVVKEVVQVTERMEVVVESLNLLLSSLSSGCSYKEFMACNPKDYDGKGGVIVYTRWIEKMESVQDMSRSRAEKPQLACPRKTLRMVAATEPKTIQSAILKVRMLTDEAIRNEALKKNTEKRGNDRDPSRDGNVKDDNKRFRTGKAFTTITNPVRKKYTSTTPKCLNCNYHHQPEVPCRWCTNYNRFGHIAKNCRVGPRIVNPLNARNSIAARGECFECGGTDHYKAACPRLNRAP
ncbi:reverse transcriptase domain-containing protein [Tanacetum coccineum]